MTSQTPTLSVIDNTASVTSNTKRPGFAAFLMLTCSLLLSVSVQGKDTTAAPTPGTYAAVNPTVKVSTGDKIEVMELFWFGCGHCFALEPHVKSWLKNDIPENAKFVKVPAVFSKRWEFHAKAYYAMVALGVIDKAEDAFFHQLHIKRQPINDEKALAKFLAEYDFSADQVKNALNSFEVDTKVRNAIRLTRASGIRGVPAMLVDGKYRTNTTMGGGQREMFDVVNQLVAKATTER